ncbi:hypothetical protein [Longirhabdus pacifica]|uniref:hypothetical protein n=1 Tax=Longirhabdus pacifica TaxID=2305227 RepID=UPI001008833E|nr:hypothetical protein [Longirhabdus pacifica]
MSYACPICNGLQNWNVVCPKCNMNTEDYGKYADFVGPYAPYQSIEQMKSDNGYWDEIQHQCIHVAYCHSCQYTFQSAVYEMLT